MTDVDDFLEHFGIKGQRWGVRRDSPSGVSSGTNRAARKDAEEFARAKLFYGQGAGTRRKLIKATVEAKSKKDPSYAKAFEHHLAKQDLSQHASKARSERSRKDKAETTKKASKSILRRLTGENGNVGAVIAAGVAGAAYLNSPAGRRNLGKASAAVKVWANSGKNKQVTNYVSNYFKNQGL